MHECMPDGPLPLVGLKANLTEVMTQFVLLVFMSAGHRGDHQNYTFVYFLYVYVIDFFNLLQAFANFPRFFLALSSSDWKHKSATGGIRKSHISRSPSLQQLTK